MPVGDVPTLQHRFAEFAASNPQLTLYSAVCRMVAEDVECADLLRSAAPGQDRPVLWLAALHDLVLQEPDLPAARWYPSVVGRDRTPDGDPWPDVRRTVLDHADRLRAVIATRSTQTNEVNRSVYLAPAFALAAATEPNRPVVLVELGASAGLLLRFDRYRVELTRPPDLVLGDQFSPVRCSGVDRSVRPLASRPPALPRVALRRGLDRHPVDLTDQAAVRWLEACLWPDVPGRIERFRAALRLRSPEQDVVVAGDMVDDLASVVDDALRDTGPDAHLVAVSSWALTYVERARRPEVASTLEMVARDGRPVTWLTAEPPGCTPGVAPPPERPEDRGQTTVLATRTWRAGSEQPPEVLGTSHPHGEWVRFA